MKADASAICHIQDEFREPL
uniref:Uncharacterized protein n=1 Tax=Anguilla anguilla TaxID=7936 RepID=A0A0E9PE58_ANGAN